AQPQAGDLDLAQAQVPGVGDRQQEEQHEQDDRGGEEGVRDGRTLRPPPGSGGSHVRPATSQPATLKPWRCMSSTVTCCIWSTTSVKEDWFSIAWPNRSE